MIDEELIAPCGMNCSICRGYLALKNDVKEKGVRMSYCAGCRPRNKMCAFIKKKCTLLQNDEIIYCYECAKFPCESLMRLDKRYRSSYRMSMIENLKFIKDEGVSKFLKKEKEKWQCKKCGELTCCHNGICFNCELDRLKNKKNPYRWEDDEDS